LKRLVYRLNQRRVGVFVRFHCAASVGLPS
jgi:hypothetical protein